MIVEQDDMTLAREFHQPGPSDPKRSRSRSNKKGRSFTDQPDGFSVRCGGYRLDLDVYGVGLVDDVSPSDRSIGPLAGSPPADHAHDHALFNAPLPVPDSVTSTRVSFDGKTP